VSPASRTIERQLRRLEDQVSPRIEDLQKRLRGADRQARVFIRERPMTCLLGAVAAGFLVGRLVRAGS
jgi:ElaB/YqjD/DUF883 family membrane-anchored ribosome-binding protein